MFFCDSVLRAYLHIVSIGTGLSENGRDGWVTANFQVIFGALVSLKKIGEEARCFDEEGRVRGTRVSNPASKV